MYKLLKSLGFEKYYTNLVYENIYFYKNIKLTYTAFDINICINDKLYKYYNGSVYINDLKYDLIKIIRKDKLKTILNG